MNVTTLLADLERYPVEMVISVAAGDGRILPVIDVSVRGNGGTTYEVLRLADQPLKRWQTHVCVGALREILARVCHPQERAVATLLGGATLPIERFAITRRADREILTAHIGADHLAAINLPRPALAGRVGNYVDDIEFQHGRYIHENVIRAGWMHLGLRNFLETAAFVNDVEIAIQYSPGLFGRTCFYRASSGDQTAVINFCRSVYGALAKYTRD